MKSLLDTSVVLDLTLERDPFFADAKQVFVRAALKEFEIFVTSVTAVNTFYTTRKERDIDVAWTAVTKLLTAAGLCQTTKSALAMALKLGFKDYEDAVQCA